MRYVFGWRLSCSLQVHTCTFIWTPGTFRFFQILFFSCFSTYIYRREMSTTVKTAKVVDPSTAVINAPKNCIDTLDNTSAGNSARSETDVLQRDLPTLTKRGKIESLFCFLDARHFSAEISHDCGEATYVFRTVKHDMCLSGFIQNRELVHSWSSKNFNSVRYFGMRTSWG